MRNSTAAAQQYLYAIVSAETVGSWGPIGVNKAQVAAITDGPVAAVVSTIAGQRARPERTNLAAHNGVLKLLMQDHAVLPVVFGTIARSPKAVRSMLVKNQAVFLKQLDYVKGRVEMGLRMHFDVPNIYDYMVNVRPELQELRDAAYGNQRVPTRGVKIDLGREFNHLLDEERAIHTATVVAVLRAHCVEIKHNPPRHEREVLNLACLIAREDLKAFEAAVLEAASQFDNNVAFNFTGPWAPYNFVDIQLGADDVAHQ